MKTPDLSNLQACTDMHLHLPVNTKTIHAATEVTFVGPEGVESGP